MTSNQSTDAPVTTVPETVCTLESYRDAGLELLQENFERFRRLVSQTEKLTRARRYDEASVSAAFAAYHAQTQHCGLFFSPQLEGALLRIGRAAVRPLVKARGGTLRGGIPKILHVSTNVTGFSGIPRLIRRWIQQDSGRSHSLALTKQAPDEVPVGLRDAAVRSGGRIHVLNAGRGRLIDRAGQLRRLASEADIVVLHVWEQDVVPILAFADKDNCPPVIHVNHGDHSFWVGAGIDDILVNLRRSGMELSAKRRAIEPERNMLLPTILEPLRRKFSQVEAKRRLGLPHDCQVLLSVARSPKYKTIGGMNFADAHVPLLMRQSRALLIVIGPTMREEWANLARLTGGRIRALGPTEETSLFYQAADIYVDSFPFPSITSLLEAGSYGVPLVSRFPFPDSCGILGPDMPGLDGNLIIARDVKDYTAVLTRLVEDENFRQELGRRTGQAIAEHHWGCNWQGRLEEVYLRAVTLPRRRDIAGQADQIYLGEPDAYLPIIHGGAYHPTWIVYFHLGIMPLRRRLQCWVALRREAGHRPPLHYLLPEWLRCRCSWGRRRLDRFYQRLKRRPSIPTL